ncbi:CCDC90 family protein [Verminephrobacter eiseniae]|uniref:CCDC90 family protein n=1 Tax=Verminephrobacter eiseniae TaxID=364317 RepID=UPI00223807FB|nr:CCDC90 family protein [Verminephrobacter eiseniae]
MFIHSIDNLDNGSIALARRLCYGWPWRAGWCSTRFADGKLRERVCATLVWHCQGNTQATRGGRMALAFPRDGKHSAQASGMNARSRGGSPSSSGLVAQDIADCGADRLRRVKRRKIARTGELTMGAVAFDTLKFVKTLEAAGVSVPQAEAISFAVREAHESVDVATKRDLKEMGVGLRHDTKEMEANLRHDMKEMETSLRHDMKEMEASLRHDMKEMEASLRHDMKEMEANLRHDMKVMEANLRHDMQKELAPIKADALLTKWMLGVLLAGVTSLILKAFF